MIINAASTPLLSTASPTKVSAKFLSIEKLKADFRQTCVRYRVDPATGSTDGQVAQATWRLSSFGRAVAAAERQKQTHPQRMSKLVYAHAARKPQCFDNGRGAVDAVKVDMRALRNWWQDADLWVQGRPRLADIAQVDLLLGIIRVNGYLVAPNDTEFEAIDHILTQAKAAESESRRRRDEIEIVPVDTIVAGVMRDLLREIMRERWEELRGMIPLKELHARQAANQFLTCQ